jgi:mannose-6-phosphate isomerase-like protein (cupin superfamily)
MKKDQPNNGTSRRDALQQIIMTGLATSLLSTATLQTNAETGAVADPLKPFYLPPAKPLELESKGINLRTWVRTSQTNMQYSCVEFIVAPKQMGPPPHLHKDLDELMYVMEGTVTIMVQDTVYEVKAGGWHMRPRGIPHTFWNGTDKPARYIDMYFNQNFEDFLEELNFKLMPEMEKNHLTPADPGIAKKWADLDKRFGITTFFDKRQPIIDKYNLKP